MDDLNTLEPTMSQQPTQPRRRRGKKLFTLFIIVVVLVGGGFALKHFVNPDLIKTGETSSQTRPQPLNIPPAEVTITSRGFFPQTVKIKKGQAIAWTNKDFKQHQVLSNPYPPAKGSFGFTAQGASRPSELFLFTFMEAGTYTYSDKLNPSTYNGTIVVE